MMMPPYTPIDLQERQEEAKEFVRRMAVEQRIYHGDMSHILEQCPNKNLRVIDMTKARMIKDDENAEVLAEKMIRKLQF